MAYALYVVATLLTSGPLGEEMNPTTRQLGVQWLDAKLMSYYVLDIGEAPQQNLDGEPVIDNKTVIALFRWDAVSDLGAVWNWDAATSV